MSGLENECKNVGLDKLVIEVDHINGDKQCDAYWNLQWIDIASHKIKSGKERKVSGVHKNKFRNRCLLELDGNTGEVIKEWKSCLEVQRAGGMVAETIAFYCKSGNMDSRGRRWKFRKPLRYQDEKFVRVNYKGKETWVSNFGRITYSLRLCWDVCTGFLSPCGSYKYTSFGRNTFIGLHRLVASIFLRDELFAMLKKRSGAVDESNQREFYSRSYLSMDYLDGFQRQLGIKCVKYEVNHKDGNGFNNQVTNLEWLSRSDHCKVDANRRAHKKSKCMPIEHFFN